MSISHRLNIKTTRKLNAGDTVYYAGLFSTHGVIKCKIRSIREEDGFYSLSLFSEEEFFNRNYSNSFLLSFLFVDYNLATSFVKQKIKAEIEASEAVMLKQIKKIESLNKVLNEKVH